MKKIFRATWPYLLLFVLSIALFHNAPSFDYVNWDDDLYVKRNPCVQSPEKCNMEKQLITPYLGYPAPLTIASYRVETLFGGPNAVTSHVLNVALHTLIVLILFGLLNATTQDLFLSLLGAILFLVHPINAEVVGWASDRKELLCTLLSLLSVAAYQGYGHGLRGLGLSMGLWLLAVAAKPVALLLFAAYVALDVIHSRIDWKRGMFYIVATLIVVADVMVSMHFEAHMGAIKAHPGLMGRLREILISAFVHTKVLLWPMVHMPKYLEPPHPAWWKLVVGAIAIIVAIVLSFRSAIQKRGSALWWLAALMLYIPVSGIIPLSRRFSDSYCYPPLVFGVAGLTLAVSTAPRRIHVYAAILAGLAIFAWGAMTSRELDKWQNGVSLWSVVYHAYPDSPQVCRNLGNAFISKRKPEPGQAVKVYEQCIATMGDRQFFLKNLGIAFILDHKPAQAINVLREFLKRHPGDRTAEKYLRIARGLLLQGPPVHP